MKILNFPELRQTYNYDCGANAVQSILAYYGIDTNESKIMKIAGTNKKEGTRPSKIIKTFEKFGLKTKSKEMTIDQVKKFIDKKIPVLLLIQAWSKDKNVNWEKDWKDGHYAIAIGYDKIKLYFEDPSSIFRTYLNYKEFEKRWHDKGRKNKKYVHYGIAVYGKKPMFSFEKKLHMD